jgi:hypothetical protein
MMLLPQGAKQLGLVENIPDYEVPVAEASDSESEDDVPPPLPPPRTESLKKEVVAVGDGVSVILADAEPFQPTNHLPVKLVSLTNGHSECEEAGSGGSVPGSGGESGGSGVSTAFSSSADQSPAKIILTEQKLEERKR